MQNVFLVTLTILIGLLWSGPIHPEMKWTATMFGLSLMELIAQGSRHARPRRPR